jgi:D-alanyl-D-alanine dipeptidase
MHILAAAILAASAPDFVDFAPRAPDAVIDMRYAGAENFVGERIDGYGRARCLLTAPAADALAAVAADLRAMGLKLRLYDCYRPQRAVDRFVRWSKDQSDQSTKRAFYPRVEKSALFREGYIAERSGHSRGSTVDLSIDGLDMGGPYDFFDETSHTASRGVPAQARANRLLLKRVMEARGFENYEKEWWHYTLKDEPYKDRYFDAPVR